MFIGTRKRTYILIATFLLLLIPAPKAAPLSGDPTFILMSYRRDSIARIDLANWKVKYLPTKLSREFLGASMKYFSCCQKVVFNGGSCNAMVGVIDLQNDVVKYLDTAKAGLGKNIMNIVLAKSNENIFYVTTTNLDLDRPKEYSAEEYNNSTFYGKYDVESETLSIIEEPNKEEGDYFPYRSDPNLIFVKNNNLLDALKNNNVFSDNHKLNKAYYTNTQYSVAIYDDQVVVVKQSESGDFKIVKSSPKDFLKTNPRLVGPYSSIIID